MTLQWWSTKVAKTYFGIKPNQTIFTLLWFFFKILSTLLFNVTSVKVKPHFLFYLSLCKTFFLVLYFLPSIEWGAMGLEALCNVISILFRLSGYFGNTPKFLLTYHKVVPGVHMIYFKGTTKFHLLSFWTKSEKH